MPNIRTWYDTDRPCLACGARWRVTEQAIDTPYLRPSVLWVAISSECADRCWPTGETRLDEYAAATRERQLRGWS